MKDDVPIITVEYEYGLRENANGGGVKILLSSGGYVMLRNLLEINGARAGKRRKYYIIFSAPHTIEFGGHRIIEQGHGLYCLWKFDQKCLFGLSFGVLLQPR